MKVVTQQFEYTASMEKVWNALTNPAMLAKWIMDNDFKPVVGHKFQFRTEPTGWWNGIIDCEVLEVNEPHRLSYTWVSGGENTTVTWTLNDSGNGTVVLHLEQSGFQSEQAFGGAAHGWVRMGKELGSLLAV
ncbi:SRPBCC domain-containing protein [Paenibacillus sp. GCM10023248]|uniref:SRPBCC family protein n=1 Tax=Bacillales TaxID=1385 RepID=UPI0023791A58|nr:MULTISPECIES: SRPBCC domain-containing protein [Bacillales]MDD9268183.1 SRPBCC domain-containing protein [Paenibacillus sp. MAHUQ-63]MDR6879862.1 uncharacterized protein YndB with AHSA1/START domain [Bacillus sp. 3255]